MAQRQRAHAGGYATGCGKVFSPEADVIFDVVPEAEIASWREKLNERYGIGTGRLLVIEEPRAED